MGSGTRVEHFPAERAGKAGSGGLASKCSFMLFTTARRPEGLLLTCTCGGETLMLKDDLVVSVLQLFADAHGRCGRRRGALPEPRVPTSFS